MPRAAQPDGPQRAAGGKSGQSSYWSIILSSDWSLGQTRLLIVSGLGGAHVHLLLLPGGVLPAGCQVVSPPGIWICKVTLLRALILGGGAVPNLGAEHGSPSPGEHPPQYCV